MSILYRSQCIGWMWMVLVVLVACEGSPSGLWVSEQQLGENWPLTVSQGYVDCIDDKYPVFRHDSVTYGLNSVAHYAGYQPLLDFWLDHPQFTGAKKSLGPLLKLAYQQCESHSSK